MITRENSYILVCTPDKNIFVHYIKGKGIVISEDAKDVYMKNHIGKFILPFDRKIDNWMFGKFYECLDIPRTDVNCFPGDKVHFLYSEISPISDNTAIVTQNSKYKGKKVYTREDLKYFPSVVYAAVLE